MGCCSSRGAIGGGLRPVEGVGVEAVQAVRHMVAQVDARQGSLAEVLCIHHLHHHMSRHVYEL